MKKRCHTEDTESEDTTDEEPYPEDPLIDELFLAIEKLDDLDQDTRNGVLKSVLANLSETLRNSSSYR